MFSFFLEVYIFYLFTLIFLDLFFFQNEISFFLIIFQLYDLNDLHIHHLLINFTIFLHKIIIIPFRNKLIILTLHFSSLIFNFQFNNLYYHNFIIIILLYLTYYY